MRLGWTTRPDIPSRTRFDFEHERAKAMFYDVVRFLFLIISRARPSRGPSTAGRTDVGEAFPLIAYLDNDKATVVAART